MQASDQVRRLRAPSGVPPIGYPSSRAAGGALPWSVLRCRYGPQLGHKSVARRVRGITANAEIDHRPVCLGPILVRVIWTAPS